MNDWKFKLMLLPINHPLHCNEDQAEQSLYALLEEGKIREINGPESGKFEPREKLLEVEEAAALITAASTG